MKLLFLFALLALNSPLALANLPLPKSGIGLAAGFASTSDYRLGDEWGKRAVTMADLQNATPAFRRAALATAKVGGATGFFLGKFNGAFVMATNHHVMPSDSCRSTTARFPLLGVNARCDSYLGTWDEIDLTLFTVRLSAEDEQKLMPVAANFQFHQDVVSGEKLLTVGFGVAGNPGSQLMGNQDSDCYVFSKTGEYRLMADPDQFNPGSYRAWSFALGCDVSHGDSGSAMVDRESGLPVGIIWTGRIPKSAEVQVSANLTKMFETRAPGIWEELSYGVPAIKMGEVLQRLLEGNTLPESTKKILAELLK